MSKEQNKYYSLNNILKNNSTYNIIFGERSNGKTYSVLKHSIDTLRFFVKQNIFPRLPRGLTTNNPNK